LLLESRTPKNLEDWSQDGRWMAYNEVVPNNSDDLLILSLATRAPSPLLRTRFEEHKGRFSPDGRWLAYQSDESGRRAEVCVQPFLPTGQKWQISSDHGSSPQWRANGRELYCSTLTTPERIMAVDITAKGNAIHAGIPHPLFDVVLQDSGARATAGW
jgi:Tol biopolymer transport system component